MRKIALLTILMVLSLKDFAQTIKYDFVVAKDGSGNFKTLQEAFNAVPDFRKNATTIFVKNGIYKEKIILAGSKINVRLIGEDAMSTILTYDDYASKKNKFDEETEFIDCRFLGFQDTLYPHGEKSRQFYKDCYIEGTVDYIFGWSTAVFDHCTIFTKKNGLYVTAASTLPETPYGFVFFNCKVTGDAPDASIYLGRPWRPFAKTVFINCTLDQLIKAEGWHNWNKPDAEKTSFYAEYKSVGVGANDKARVSWSHQLTDNEMKNYTLEKIFGDWKVN